ncbi:GntR family transcriptional regulator [Nocardia salmonicida]|uniref:GntR family transcriptional regulator n=1 Tax=Nocardia salmonicida TaxID=53431 RepID=UPI0007A3CE5C|nr:GntR family transcriptional regulator [Nocardia salmonicida]MBC7299540.1 GntR family transcriptional regulator [Nocardia sp.]
MSKIKQQPPPYQQIANDLRDQIVRGDLRPGDKIPSERELAKHWGVSRPTASSAVTVLRRQQLVESRVGSGTVVRDVSAAPRARERYDRAAALGTMYSDAETVEFPFVGVVEAPEDVALALGVEPGSAVVRRCRVITNEHRGPIEFSTSWFPADLAEKAPSLLVAERLRGGTLRYLAETLDLRASFARDQVSARLATETECADLELDAGSAVLVYWLVAYGPGETPLQVDEAIYPPGTWAFRQEYPITLRPNS